MKVFTNTINNLRYKKVVRIKFYQAALVNIIATLYIRGTFNMFVERGFFYTIQDFFFSSFLCSVNLCQLNDISRSVNAYIFAFSFS